MYSCFKCYNFLFAATFSNFPSSAYAYSTISVTWTAPSKSGNGDWIGLFVQGVYTASWYANVAAGVNSGTYSLTMPNTPGPMVFSYIRNGYVATSSSVITCLAAPSGYPTPFPTAPTLFPTPQPTSFAGGNYYIKFILVFTSSVFLYFVSYYFSYFFDSSVYFACLFDFYDYVDFTFEVY